MSKQLAITEVDKIVKKSDTDLNGWVDYSEFICAAINKQKLLSGPRMKAAF